jgi:hypothetical protein
VASDLGLTPTATALPAGVAAAPHLADDRNGWKGRLRSLFR